VLHSDALGNLERRQQIGVLRDRVGELLEFAILDPPQGKKRALLDLAVAPIRLDEVVVRLPGAVARGADEHAADSPRLARVGPQHLAHYEQNVHCIFLNLNRFPVNSYTCTRSRGSSVKLGRRHDDACCPR